MWCTMKVKLSCCVRCYLCYVLSYRDLEEMMYALGLSRAHTTIYRWVQHFGSELEKRMYPQRISANLTS